MQNARWIVLAALFSVMLPVQGQEVLLKIEEVMTPQEMHETGVASLTPSQREALNKWLVRYTEVVASVAARQPRSQAAGSSQPRKESRSACNPAIESSISGDFEGWGGETVFKLDNGQIWEQAEYDYTYDYEYHPDVTIYPTSAGCRMKVEDLDETILVRRIK